MHLYDSTWSNHQIIKSLMVWWWPQLHFNHITSSAASLYGRSLLCHLLSNHPIGPCLTLFLFSFFRSFNLFPFIFFFFPLCHFWLLSFVPDPFSLYYQISSPCWLMAGLPNSILFLCFPSNFASSGTCRNCALQSAIPQTNFIFDMSWFTFNLPMKQIQYHFNKFENVQSIFF